MASPSHSVGRDEAAAPGLVAAANSCNRCRKTKLRCSRDRPACSHCSKAGEECTYEYTRGKPGIKAGAIDNLHRRLEQIESRLSIQEAGRQPGLGTPDSSSGNHATSTGLAERVLALLATELPKLANPPPEQHSSPPQGRERTAKRRRVESSHSSPALLQDLDERPPLPSTETIDAIVVAYFSLIHSWIPMLHQDIFPQRLKSAEGLRKLRVIIHAASLAVEHHMPSGHESSPSATFDAHWTADRVRTWVVTTALESVTLEGLQALIIIAFNDIGNGNASRAWSLVATLTRTVEFAQLSREHDEDQRHFVCRPFTNIEPARNWTEQEERRRVFWCIFLLDRFCSITMGWNTGLKSVDVHQRMPSDGGLWRREISGLTPYLGVWDKSTGDVGASSCCCHGGDQPASAMSSEPWAQPGGIPSASSNHTNDTMVDMSRVGAFGYYIEATESMSRVVSYFLQQRVNMDNPNEVSSWLVRFKELDLRLVHWKMFLPQKWNNNVPPSTKPYGRLRIDPNLTLAHVTHNTSTILLHQVIAYPPPEWSFRKRLPRAWSTDTCCLAAVEIATITQKFLEVTPAAMPVSCAFTFCVYMAARMMIIHWRYEEGNKLMDEFWDLVNCLDEMSVRWVGVNSASTRGPDLGAKYAQRLRDLWKLSSEDANFRILASDYTCEMDYRAPAPAASPHPSHPVSMTPGMPQEAAFPPPQQQHAMQGQSQGQWAPSLAGSMLQAPAMPGTSYPTQATQQPGNPSADFAAAVATSDQPSWGSMGSHAPSGSDDMQIGNMFGHLDASMDMDRVIAFADTGLFTAELENAGW